MKALQENLLKEAAACFKDARKNIYHGAALLYEIRENHSWEGQYSSFTDYIESECQLSHGFVSKLLTAWQYYVIDGSQRTTALYDIDYEKLYLATKLPKGTPEQRLVKAREWTRRDLKDALAEDENGDNCIHPEDKRVTICGICHTRVG